MCGKIGLTFFFSLVLFALPDVSSELKFPRQRLTKRKASKQFEAAKCADGTMSPLIESGRDLCISREGVGAVCRFPICAFTRRLCAGPVRKNACVQIISDAAVWKNSSVEISTLRIRPRRIWKHRPILNWWLNKFLLKSNGGRDSVPRKRAWTTIRESN